MKRATGNGTNDAAANLSADEVAALKLRVRLLELAVVDYAERYGLTDLARVAMVDERPSIGGRNY